MDTLTPELKRAVEQAGDSPVRLTDRETHGAYVLFSSCLAAVTGSGHDSVEVWLQLSGNTFPPASRQP